MRAVGYLPTANSLPSSSFFQFCQLHFSRDPPVIRPEDHMLKPPRQAVVKTTILPNGQKHEEEMDLLTDFSWRNFFATINFAKIMQKLSKHRSHRIRMMVQYKSSVSTFSISDPGDSLTPTFRSQAVLKRILKVQHPVLQLHVLKLIKNQVPFCGRKWRQCEYLLSIPFRLPPSFYGVSVSRTDRVSFIPLSHRDASQHAGHHRDLSELPAGLKGRMAERERGG